MSEETSTVFNSGINFDESFDFTDFLFFLNSYFEDVSLEELHFFITNVFSSSKTEVPGWHIFTHDENVSFENDELSIDFTARNNCYDPHSMSFRSFVGMVWQQRTCCDGCFAVKRPLRFWLNIISEYVAFKNPNDFFFAVFFTEDSFKVSSSFEENVVLLKTTGSKISLITEYYDYKETHDKLFNLYLPYLYHLQKVVRDDEAFVPYVNTQLFSELVSAKFLGLSFDADFIKAYLLKDEAWRYLTQSQLKSLVYECFGVSLSKSRLGDMVNTLMQVKKHLLSIAASSEVSETLCVHDYASSREYRFGDFNAFTIGTSSLFLAYVYASFTNNLFYMLLPTKFFEMFNCYSYRIDWVHWEDSYSSDVLSNTIGLYRSLEEDFRLPEIVEAAATI